MCDMLNVRRQDYYEWLDKEPTPQQRRDETLTEKITSIMDRHRHRLGTRRVRTQLARLGERASHKRAHRLMQTAGLRCRHPRRRRSTVNEVRMAVFQFIEGYYNRHRPHSTLNYRTPEEQEEEVDPLALNAA